MFLGWTILVRGFLLLACNEKNISLAFSLFTVFKIWGLRSLTTSPHALLWFLLLLLVSFLSFSRYTLTLVEAGLQFRPIEHNNDRPLFQWPYFWFSHSFSSWEFEFNKVLSQIKFCDQQPLMWFKQQWQ